MLSPQEQRRWWRKGPDSGRGLPAHQLWSRLGVHDDDEEEDEDASQTGEGRQTGEVKVGRLTWRDGKAGWHDC